MRLPCEVYEKGERKEEGGRGKEERGQGTLAAVEIIVAAG